MLRPLRTLLIAPVLLALLPAAAAAFEGRVVDQKSGRPIAGAEVTIVGLTGSVKTDADGRFTWTPDPKPPFTVVVILPGGAVARPIRVQSADWGAVLTLVVVAAVTEEVTVGVAPSIDATPGAALTMLSAADIQLRAPANLMQAVESVAGVSQVSEGQAAVPAVRGLARGRTLMLIDGSRVTSERRVGPSATFMDPAVIEGVDVARGPGSVAYGSDAFGGVISVRTRRPPHSGRVLQAAGTFGEGIPDRRAEVMAAYGFGSGGVLGLAHVRDAGDYRGPDGRVLNSGWKDRGFLVRVERRAAGGLVGGSWQADFARDVERPRNNSHLVRIYSPYENSHRFTGSYERPAIAGLTMLRLTGFFGASEQRSDQDRAPTPAAPRQIARADISASDFQIRAVAEKLIGDSKIEFGADLNGRVGLEAHDVTIAFDLDGTAIDTIDNESIHSARRTDTGVFVQAETPLGGRVTAAGGVRAQRVATSNEDGFFGDRRVTNSAAAGFGSISVKPLAELTLTAQLARGFRDPTLSDRFYRGPSGRGFITGNPDLRSEKSVQLDLSARYATGRLRLAGYVYHYRISNLVERFETDPDFFLFRNRGRARIRGVEVEAQADLGRGYWLDVTAQRMRGQALDDDAALDDMSPDNIGLGLRKAWSLRVLSYVRVSVYARDDRAGPSEIVQPGYAAVDAGVTWVPADRLELRFAGRNLLDEFHYASPDPRFVAAPGVNGFVTALVRF